MSENAYLHGVHSEEQARLAELNRLTNAPFVEFLKLPTHGTVLEVGSGLGLLAADVARTSSSLEVFGIERSAEQLAAAQAGPQNLFLQQGDAHYLPFDDNFFDVVYCRYVLEHLADPTSALKEMYRVLKPGGRVAVQENDMSMIGFDPDCPTLMHWVGKMIEAQAAVDGDATVGRKLFRLLKQAGFSGIELTLQPELHWYGSPRFDAWIRNGIDIINGTSVMMIELGKVTQVETDQAIGELRGLLSNEVGSCVFHWNRAQAIKPVEVKGV
ncbi:MAG: methyltransferase domain-containing protein [Chthonomonadales bacterium]